MDDNRLPRQAVYILRYKRFKEKAGKTMKEVSSKEDAIQQDLKSIGMTWEVAQQLAVNREGWRRRVAQCIFDTG